jgi:hypothetical protein
MTIQNAQMVETYAGNGSTTAFSFPHYWIDDVHIFVELVKISDSSITAQTLGVDYTLVGEGVLSGGTVTMIVAPPTTHNLVIRRIVPFTQLDDWIAHDQFRAETLEKDLDLLTMEIQQLNQGLIDLDVSGLGAFTMQNIGAAGVSVFAGSVGTLFQFKKITGTAGITATEDASQITLTGSGAGSVDLAAAYPWTGLHTHTKQAARTAPSWIIKSLQGGVDITDSAILLANDYVTAMDVRKNTDVSIEAPVDASWGGNAGIYIQHKAAGTCGANGTLTLGIRAQLETTQAKGASLVNDAVCMYAGVYNNGTDVGAFGHHVDAYHVGTAGAGGHSTLGMSSEVYKQITGGTAAGYVTRSQGSQLADFGLLICHAGGSQWRRGIQLGSPTYANGGVQGAPGTATGFAVGIDLTWGNYTFLAMSVKRDTVISLSGLAQAQTATPDVTCAFYWGSATGNFTIANGGSTIFEVNMTNGLIRQNNNDAIAFFTSLGYAFRCSSTNKTASTVGGAGGASAPPATPDTWLIIQLDGSNRKIPLYNA